MLIHWSTILFLLAKLILTNGSEFAARNSSAKDRQWVNNSTNIKLLNGGPHQSSKATGIYFSKEIQKINLSHQGTISQRRDKSEEMHSAKNSYEKLITNLSKFANVRSAEKHFLTTGRVQVPNASAKSTEEPTLFDTKLFSRLRSNYNTSNSGIKRRNVRCYAVPKTTYTPDINELFSTYACKLEGKIFILLSKGFLEDRRTSVYISIDDETLDKIHSPVTDAERDRLRIIPATLVLQEPGYNYYIRDQENVISREGHN